MTCCLCGGDDTVKWCKVCQHAFCRRCRFAVRRATAAYQEMVNRTPPPFCRHDVKEEAHA